MVLPFYSIPNLDKKPQLRHAVDLDIHECLSFIRANAEKRAAANAPPKSQLKAMVAGNQFKCPKCMVILCLLTALCPGLTNRGS